MNDPLLQLAFPAAALACGCIASVSDVKSRRIPNLLTGPAMLIGLALNFAAYGLRGLESSMGALLLCGAVFLVIHVAGGMGAGDVKLVAAEGCILGLSNAAALLAFTAICGGLMAVVLAARHGRLRETSFNVAAILSHHSQRGLVPHPDLNLTNSATLRLPYALAIGAGTLLTVLMHTASGLSW